jgi:hypothetical protein
VDQDDGKVSDLGSVALAGGGRISEKMEFFRCARTNK